MLVEYPCAMQRRNIYQRRERDLFKCAVAITIVLQIYINAVTTAPTPHDSLLPPSSEISEYFSDISGCYYNFQRYEEGDRIVTNEPCLNCTCHNRMLMCYLRVCPFTKAIGQDCTIEKKPDQCCPIITCPEVPVKLLTSSTTSSPIPTTPTTEIGFHDNYGCTIHNSFYADGAQVPSDPRKPCELCYCIRNRTACVMQECTLHVEGCKPVYQDGVCCPVRYDCDYEKEFTSTSRTQTSDGNVVKSTTYTSVVDCQFGNQSYADGELITTDKPCEHCYCMRGDIVCAVQDCGEPLRGKDCVPTMPPPELCCPSSYDCSNDTSSTEGIPKASVSSNTELPVHFSTFESSSLPSRSPDILSQEQIYEKLGEPTSIPSLTGLSSLLSSSILETSTSHFSENIQLDENTINASEHLSTTTYDEEKNRPSVVAERLTTISEDTQSIDYTTEKASTFKPNSLSAVPETTMLSEQVITKLPVPFSSVMTIKTPTQVPLIDGVPSSDLSSHGEELVTNQIIYQSTSRSPAETTKFESNEILDKITTESVIHESSTLMGNSNENVETTGYPPSPDGNQDQLVFGEQSSSSEANRYTFTTREFERSTTMVKGEMTGVTNNLENIASASSPDQALSQHTDERITENIDTFPEKITESIPPRETSVSSSSSADSEKVPSIITTEDVATALFGVPGEGSCLVDGITYSNSSIIESSNPCHDKCICLSSIPTCTLVTCQTPPNDPKCMPVQIKPESCCPVYVCSGDEPERISQTQITSHNHVTPDQPELDHLEGQQNQEPADVDNQTTEGGVQNSLESNAFSPSGSESERHPDNQVQLTLSTANLPTFLNKNETIETFTDSTKVPESTTSISQAELATEWQTQKPVGVLTDENTAISENQDQDVTTTESAAPETSIPPKQNYMPKRPPIVVISPSEVPVEHTEVYSSEVSSVTEDPPHAEVNYVPLPTAVDDNGEDDIKTTVVTSIGSNDLPSSSPEYVQQDEIADTASLLTPTKIAAVVVTNEDVTKQTTVTSEPVGWNENKTDGDAMTDDYPHTTYQAPSDTPENIKTTSAISESSSGYGDFGSSEESSIGSLANEAAQSTTSPEIADSPSTKKENVAETDITTNQPDNNEVLTTVPAIHETTVSNDGYSSPGLYLSTTLAEESSKETSDESVVTNTAASETTVQPYDETTTTPSIFPNNKVGSTDTFSDGPSSEVVPTTILGEISSEFGTVTESIYTKDSQHSHLLTATGAQSSTEYEEIKITLPSSSSSSPTEDVQEALVTGVSSSDEVHTTRTPETNEIVFEEGSTPVPQIKNTPTPIFSNVSENEPLPSPFETSSSYIPIQQPTWTPKPFDNSNDSSSSISGNNKATAPTEVSSPPPLSYPNSGADINGVNNGSDNTSMEEYDEEPNGFGTGTCRYNGKLYISAQQIPRDDPCDFCFCFRSDIICLQQSCPPPIHGCRQEPIQGFCCPRYECPVARDISLNATIPTSTAKSTSFSTARTVRNPHDSHRSSAQKRGCVINGYFYNVGENIAIASGPCLECICGLDGRMKCDPKLCSPEPYVRQMIEESSYRR